MGARQKPREVLLGRIAQILDETSSQSPLAQRILPGSCQAKLRLGVVSRQRPGAFEEPTNADPSEPCMGLRIGPLQKFLIHSCQYRGHGPTLLL